MTTQQNEYLRPSQIAKEYPISQSSLWRYAKLGLLQPKKVTNGVTVFLRSELEAFFSGKSQMEVTQ
jgi:predicted DNA-binding transcriptional regulator AlpA